MTKYRFWPKTAGELALLPTAEIWDHISETKRIPGEKRAKLALTIDLYTDLETHLRDSKCDFGDRIFMLSWDATISDLPEGSKVSMSQLLLMWKQHIFTLLMREMYMQVPSPFHSPFRTY